MSVIIREIAGLSITKVTDEMAVFPVEIIGVDQILVKVAPTILTQVGARYLIGVKVDRGSQVDVLDLEEIRFTQPDIDNLTNFTFPFTIPDLESVESFIVEAFLDASIASVRVVVGPASVGVATGGVIEIDTGNAGLAGFIIDISIVDSAIAKIIGVEFPPEFSLSQFDPDPVNGPTVKVSGVDLGDAVQGGEFNVQLISFVLEGLTVGKTDLDVVVTQLDDDKGFPVRHTLIVDFFSVTS